MGESVHPNSRLVNANFAERLISAAQNMDTAMHRGGVVGRVKSLFHALIAIIIWNLNCFVVVLEKIKDIGVTLISGNLTNVPACIFRFVMDSLMLMVQTVVFSILAFFPSSFAFRLQQMAKIRGVFSRQVPYQRSKPNLPKAPPSQSVPMSPSKEIESVRRGQALSPSPRKTQEAQQPFVFSPIEASTLVQHQKPRSNSPSSRESFASRRSQKSRVSVASSYSSSSSSRRELCRFGTALATRGGKRGARIATRLAQLLLEGEATEKSGDPTDESWDLLESDLEAAVASSRGKTPVCSLQKKVEETVHQQEEVVYELPVAGLQEQHSSSMSREDKLASIAYYLFNPTGFIVGKKTQHSQEETHYVNFSCIHKIWDALPYYFPSIKNSKEQFDRLLEIFGRCLGYKIVEFVHELQQAYKKNEGYTHVSLREKDVMVLKDTIEAGEFENFDLAMGETLLSLFNMIIAPQVTNVNNVHLKYQKQIQDLQCAYEQLLLLVREILSSEEQVLVLDYLTSSYSIAKQAIFEEYLQTSSLFSLHLIMRQLQQKYPDVKLPKMLQQNLILKIAETTVPCNFMQQNAEQRGQLISAIEPTDLLAGMIQFQKQEQSLRDGALFYEYFLSILNHKEGALSCTDLSGTDDEALNVQSVEGQREKTAEHLREVIKKTLPEGEFLRVLLEQIDGALEGVFISIAASETTIQENYTASGSGQH